MMFFIFARPFLRENPVTEPLYTDVVHKDWIDYNGHMNDAYYALVFSRTLDRLMAKLGLQQDGRTPDSPTIYTLTATIHFLAELHEGERFTAEARILAHDAKRLHLWADLFGADGRLSASTEQIFLCVDQSGATPRAAPFPPAVMARIEEIESARGHEPMPARTGQGISLAKR